MDFTPVPGGTRPLPPAQGFPLPSSIQPLPMSSPSTGLSGAQDFARLQTTGRLTTELHLQEKDGLPAASSLARSGPDPLLDMQSILATMQDTFLQQVKGLLGVAPAQPSLGPSVPTDMGQDVLWQPSPAGDWEGQNEQGRVPGHVSDLVIRPLLSAEMDGLGIVAVVLSALTTPPTDHAQGHLLPSGIESVVGVQDVITPALWLEAGAHRHLVTTGPAPTPQPASVDAARHRLHVGLHPRDVARHLRQDGRLLSDATPMLHLLFQRMNSTIMEAQLMSHESAMMARELFTHLYMLRRHTVLDTAGVDLPQREKDSLIFLYYIGIRCEPLYPKCNGICFNKSKNMTLSSPIHRWQRHFVDCQSTRMTQMTKDFARHHDENYGLKWRFDKIISVCDICDICSSVLLLRFHGRFASQLRNQIRTTCKVTCLWKTNTFFYS